MMQKIKSQKGDSILETLFALIIIIFSFALLANSIVISGKINAIVKKENIGFTYYDVNIKNGKVDLGDMTNSDYQQVAVVTAVEQNTAGEGQSNILASGTQFYVYKVRNYVINSNKPKYFIFQKIE